MQEEYYPRGGSKPKIKNGIAKSDNLFDTLRRPKQKGKRPKEDNQHLQIEHQENLRLTSADLLTYDKILPGILILGCVRKVTPYTLQVELPGLTFARIEINAISDILSKNLLEKAKSLDEADIQENILSVLPKLFTQGQYLPISVLDIGENDNTSKHVSASINPKHVNVHLTHKVFKKGMLVWGSIVEISDYVYIVDLGVKNTRVLLPFKNCQEEKFVEGQPSWFTIKELQMQDKTATITLSPVKDEVHATDETRRLDQILPGTCVEFRITKILKNGLEGVYFNDYIGYINQIYLEEPMQQLQKYEGAVVKAYVLYIQPTTKFTYLTMRSIRSSPKLDVLPNGHTCSAKITHNIGKGVIVQFKKNELGLVTYKRLVQSLKLRDTSDLSDLVKRKFPVGSSHHCRILDYINMDKMYICTFEKDVIKEEIFNINDLKPGQLVKGSVDEINKSGIVVKIGKLTGFATNEHLSNAEYSDNMKRNYHVGDQVSARIWDINGSSIKLTLKPTFIKDDRCLTAYELAKRNDQYPGMVVKSYQKGALICFYGGVKGWLKHTNLERDCTNMFYQGQVVTLTVLLSNEGKLILTLDPPERINNKKIQIGHVVSGFIESIDTGRFLVRTNPGNFQGILPVNQLSVESRLSKAIFDLFSVGDKIENLICISKEKRRILSMRECDYYKNNKLIIPKLNQLTPGLILRCSVKSFDKKRILLTSPILYYSGDIVVNKQDVMDIDELPKNVNLFEGQPVFAKVTSINKKQITATMKLSEVYNYDYKHPVSLLSQYLNDVEKIKQKLISDRDTLAQYKIGQRVNCRITKINNIGCSVTLDDGIQGIVAPEYWPNKPLVNSVHLGVVLYINYVDRYLEISLNTTINQKISTAQDANDIAVGQTLYARVLLIRPEFVLCGINHRSGRQIGYMPTRLHENDFMPNLDIYRNMNKAFKFVVCSTANCNIIGLEKSLKKTLVKDKKLQVKTTNVKRKLPDANKVEDENRQPAKKRRLSASADSRPSDGNNRKIKRETTSIVSKSDRKELSTVKSSDVADEETKDSSDEMSVDENEISEESASETGIDENKIEEESDSSFDDNIQKDGINSTDENDDSNDESEDEEAAGENDGSSDESEDEEVSDSTPDKLITLRNQKMNEEEESDSSVDHNDALKEQTSEESNSDDDSSTTELTALKASVVPNGVKRSLNGDNSPKTGQKFLPPSINNFFDSDDENSQPADSSDEEVVEEQVKSKKKKLTRAEQVDLINKQEEELRQKEIEFANPTGVPQSAAQFDRRLLAEPNSSELWTQYISFHLASTEIDKARAVIRRALQTIAMTAEQDRLNVWNASLNLENYYGTKETFNKVFEEAVRCNDDFSVYMQAIKILSSSTESSNTLAEYIKKCRAKFKQEPRMYIEIGRMYYTQQKFNEARKLKDTALKTITNITEHIPLIVQFGIMEFNLGEEHQAEVLFETVIQSQPKRVDVWCTYVDQLTKRNKIDIARRVLERAVSQKLNIRKMKSLHKKFHEFEKVYGNDETKAQQRKLLDSYAKQFGNLNQ